MGGSDRMIEVVLLCVGKTNRREQSCADWFPSEPRENLNEVWNKPRFRDALKSYFDTQRSK